MITDDGNKNLTNLIGLKLYNNNTITCDGILNISKNRIEVLDLHILICRPEGLAMRDMLTNNPMFRLHI